MRVLAVLHLHPCKFGGSHSARLQRSSCSHHHWQRGQSDSLIWEPDLPPVLFLILHNFIYEPLFYIFYILSSICLRLFYAFLIFASKRRGNALTTLKKRQQRQSWKKSWVQLSSTRTQSSLKRAWQTLLLLTMAMEMAFTFHQCPGSEECQQCQQCQHDFLARPRCAFHNDEIATWLASLCRLRVLRRNPKRKVLISKEDGRHLIEAVERPQATRLHKTSHLTLFFLCVCYVPLSFFWTLDIAA